MRDELMPTTFPLSVRDYGEPIAAPGNWRLLISVRDDDGFACLLREDAVALVECLRRWIDRAPPLPGGANG